MHENEIFKNENDISIHENDISMHENNISMHENNISMHENNISMHENDISMHENENLAPGRFFSPQIFPCVVELYRTSWMEFLPIKIFGQNFLFHA